MRFLDTNILLRYFTKDDEKKANDVLRLLKKVEKEFLLPTPSISVLWKKMELKKSIVLTRSLTN